MSAPTGVSAVARFFELKAKEMLPEWRELSDSEKQWFISECERALSENA